VGVNFFLEKKEKQKKISRESCERKKGGRVRSKSRQSRERKGREYLLSLLGITQKYLQEHIYRSIALGVEGGKGSHQYRK